MITAPVPLQGAIMPGRIALTSNATHPFNNPVITKDADAVLKPHRTILDTPTPQSDQIFSSSLRPPTPQSDHPGGLVKPGLSPSSRRLFSRSILGLKIPGRYYFITWTSSPQSPPIEKSWRALSNWLKRKRPGASWCYCITNEGHGVIHMIMRLGKREQRLDVKEVRAHWTRLHKANQIKIKHVPESMKNNLAAYLGDQRSKRSLGGEMAWQDGIVRWRWSKGWLPQGFTKAFGRVWVSLLDLSPGLREKAIYDWLHACHEDPVKLMNPPHVKEGDLYYPESPDRSRSLARAENQDELAGYDRELRMEIKELIPPMPAVGMQPVRLPAWKRSDCRICPYYFKYTGILCEGCV